jgi:hypothetical protein
VIVPTRPHNHGRAVSFRLRAFISVSSDLPLIQSY